MAPLDMPLPFPEDQNLSYMTKPEPVEIFRPPGVQNLRQWGQMVLPEGKHKGKSFQETVEQDYQYAQWIDKHRTLASDWAKSFQGFVRAWNQMNVVTIQNVNTPRPMAKSKLPMCPSPKGTWSETEEEEMILVPENRKTEGKVASGGKRSYVEEKGDHMETEVNAELVAQLRCQIALLQRELEKVTNKAATSSVQP